MINLRFIDSYKHLTSPLDGLVKSLLSKDIDILIDSIKNFPYYFNTLVIKHSSC